MNASQIATFDPLSAEYLTNPWAELKRMRESCRAYRHKGTIMPVVSFFHERDIRAIREDWQTWSSVRSIENNQLGIGKAAVMLTQDPPEHTRYRNIIAPLFEARRIAALQPKIDQHVTRLLDKHIDNGEINFMEDVSGALATAMIGTICAIPEQDWPFIRKNTIGMAIDYGKALFFREPQPRIIERISGLQKEMAAYIGDHIDRLRRTNTPSILADIANQLDDDESLIGLCMLIIATGNDTSADLMTNGLYELMQKPDQLQWLRNNPDKINQAIEEMVRCRGSLRRSERVATKDLEFDGVQIHKGDCIALWNASASRDPEVVPDRPDEFDIRRLPTRHMGFGAGIHSCPGKILARLKTRTLMRAILERTSRIEECSPHAYESWGNGILDAVKHYRLKLYSI